MGLTLDEGLLYRMHKLEGQRGVVLDDATSNSLHLERSLTGLQDALLTYWLQNLFMLCLRIQNNYGGLDFLM